MKWPILTCIVYFMLSERTHSLGLCAQVQARVSRAICDMRISLTQKLHFHNRIFIERSVSILIYLLA